MRKKRGVQIMAILALFGITVGILGTGLLIIFGGDNSQNNKQSLTPAQIKQLQEMIKTNSGITISTGSVDTSTGTKTLTGKTN